MSLGWNVVGLVLASATGWAALALGTLPVALLREHAREPLKLAGAWTVVAALSPPGVFHWYLIFTLLCLVAWTKIDRPGGKVFLALAAALGLSLGIIFPLEISPPLFARENPFQLVSLYLGGAAAGLAYAAFILTPRPLAENQRPPRFATGLLLAAMAWLVLLATRSRLEVFPAFAPVLPPSPPGPHLPFLTAILFGLGSLLILLAMALHRAGQRRNRTAARLLAAGAFVFALAASLLEQFIYR